MSLIVAVGILGVLSIVGATVMFAAGANNKSANYSNASQEGVCGR